MGNLPCSPEEYRTWWREQRPEIPYGQCWCGCGGHTSIPSKNDASRNKVKGEPMRYLHGHHVQKYFPDNLLEHRLIEDTGYETPCWIWQGQINRGGYGEIGRPRRAVHVVAWEQENGPVPPAHELDHLCRIPPCFNPSHLEAVTHTENMRRGKPTKLTKEQVVEMRRLKEKTQVDNGQLSEMFNISRRQVSSILCGNSWKDC